MILELIISGSICNKVPHLSRFLLRLNLEDIFSLFISKNQVNKVSESSFFPKEYIDCEETFKKIVKWRACTKF